MKKLVIIAALIASPALSQQADPAGTNTDPFASTPGATSMAAGSLTTAAVIGGLAIAGVIAAVSGSSSSSTTN